MISNTAPVTSGIPTQTCILGTVTSPDISSSFADQLASAVNQVGSNPQTGGGNSTNIIGAQRQNSDTPAAPPASAAGSPAVQYSFFQYLMDTPSATAAASPISAPGASNVHSALAPSTPGMQQSGAPDSSTGDSGWLAPPYYTPPATTYVSWESPKGVINTTASPESDLQNLAAQFINDPLQFEWGSVPATTPQELVDNFVSYAQSRAAMYPQASPAGYDPVAMGTKYANLVMDSIKKIQYDTVGTSQYASIYDAWVAGVNTFPGASGATSASTTPGGGGTASA